MVKMMGRLVVFLIILFLVIVFNIYRLYELSCNEQVDVKNISVDDFNKIANSDYVKEKFEILWRSKTYY